MTIFVVPLTRALPLSLMKAAFSRGPNPGHKYIKRVPYFVKGKRRYRYYYADDVSREAGKALHDPHGEHDHHLIQEQREHHPNLVGKLTPTTGITPQTLKKGLGISGTTVKVGGEFHTQLVKPAIEAEEAGGDPKRTAFQRTLKAFEMLPDYIKEMVDPETIEEFKGTQVSGQHGMYKGLKRFELNTQSEDPYVMAFMCAGYADPVDGELHVLDVSFKEPVGIPKFKSAVTRGEEVVWHEFGHHAHFAMEARPKEHPDRKAIEAWKKGLPGKRISDYAYTAWYEDFAETFACAISHPKELAEDCAERYEWMRKHVLTSLPPIGEMLDTPDGELSWWDSKPNTPASKMLNHLRHRRPPPRFHTYYSEKDQFYSVQKEGRLLYVRIGPASKEEEDGWDRMPDTHYTETIEGVDGKPLDVTLPKHERTLGPRFKKTESIKEIYDENGQPLTDKQAYFYLGQDDDKVIAHAGESVPDKMDEYLKKTDKKKDDTHLLSYKMYTTLGFQLEHGKELERLKKVVEKQRAYDAALKKKRAGKKLTSKEAILVNEYEETEDPKTGKKQKGKKVVGDKPRPDFHLERHEWAPTPIDRDLFVQKTGTFKFGELRAAADQPWTARDPDTQKIVTRYDEALGKQVPVLTARIYEQENPDGTFTRISISESSPFRAGQKIYIPTAEGVQRIELKKGMSLDPFELAREFGTSAAELLALNHRYDRGQITDPILAALINPHGKPIMDSTTLTQMMRDAALDTHVDKVTGRLVGRRAWVTIRGGTRAEHGIGHLQVEFDGAGPPKVVGDYWARKLGKNEIRIDELINARDEIDIPRIIERKPKKGGTTQGSLVWFMDPKTNKRRLGTVVERKGKAFIVQPEKGANKRAVAVGRVRATFEDTIPDSPLLRRRLVQPLEHDILFYMDEVPRDSGTESPEGTIKILLPTDGRFDLEDMKALSGVRIIEPKGGKALELTLSPEDIPRIREALGGFVMDSRVKAKLKQLDDRSRTLAEDHSKKQIIEYDDLEDEDGNVNPKGPLGGLVVGDEGIQPGEHRMRALQKLAKNGGRLYAAHFMGCLSGDTEIPINRCGKGFTITLRELYEKQNNLAEKHAWDMTHSTYATSLFDQYLRLNEVLNVVDSGTQETFLVRTKRGREIRATEMHPFWTPRGWVSLSDLRPGDQVGVRGAIEPTGRAPKKYKYRYRTNLQYHPYAGVRGAKTSPYRVPTHRLVAEARLNSLELDELIRRCRLGGVEGLQFIDPTVYAVHHKDEDTFNNDPDNLEVLPHVEHWKLHGEKDGWTNFNQFRLGWDEVEFVGDERTEPTYDICMHVQSQSYVANDFVVHNTGKTALAIMAAEMMRKLKDPATGKPHPMRSTKRTLHIVPLNTAENWHQEYTKFATPPTLIGSSNLSGSVQIPKLPERKANENDAAYAKRSIQYWKDGLASHPGWWNPWEDNRDNVVIAYEYFQQNEAALDMLEQFDGLVVDEAHRIALDNEVSRAIERWNPKMKLFLLLSGTPITNTIDTLPRIVDLVTGGQTQLGSREEFREVYLVASAVLKAMGKKNPPKTDLNPQKIGELAAILQPIMDVATTADVKGKSMPAVLLDENEPAHMTGQQARMYRAAMAVLTPEERDALGVSSSLGIDEAALLGDEARRKVAVARSLANCLSYKAPSQRENAIYETMEYTKDRKGKLSGKMVKKEFTLPTLRQLTQKRPKGWGGKWPTDADVEAGVVDRGYLTALQVYMDNILGVAYESLAGKKIDKKLLAAVKADRMETKTGEPWGKEGGKLKNPDYGPEGMMCRGTLNESTGEVNPLKTTYFDSESGEWKDVEIPVGMRFIRDPNAKAAGVYYHEEDWDFTGRFSDDGESSQGDPGGSQGGDDGEPQPVTKRKKGQQGPKPGLEGYSVQRHPSRRKERAMFDAITTTGNAKCDKLEQNMRSIFKEETGSGSDSQMIIFGNRIGSSVRTVEAKLRTMGYMDVNEALGNPEWSTEGDKKRAAGTRKFFVSYMGVSATLGDRDINSEIFRRQQDAFGKDTGISMLVWRTMYGTSKQKYLKPGEMREPWGRSHRKKIAKNFMDGSGRMSKNGKPAGLEIPMRVVGSENADGSIGQQYIYESDVPSGVRREVQQLETQVRSQRGAAADATMAKISGLLMPYAVDRKPLTDAQIDIFNNTQLMVASDAANVGLNWPCEHLTMYDSLFSPMEEWQRITRAARMLPPAVRGPAKKLIEKVGAYIDKIEAKNDFKEYENVDSAILIVNEALENALTPAERMELNDLPGGAPDQIVEAWFAKRAFGKIASLREEVGNRLRSEGAVPDPTKPPGPGNFIDPKAIQGSDVINEIIRKHLTSFDREVMKSRRYLVDVKRLTTSVDVPEFETVKIIDPITGKKRKIKIPTGKFITESPSQAERAQLAQGRAKMVPYEFLLKVIQSAMPTHTKYDYVESYRASLGMFSRMPDDAAPAPGPEPSPVDAPSPTGGQLKPKPKPEKKSKPKVKKALFHIPLGGR